jgi:hypothetical protein
MTCPVIPLQFSEKGRRDYKQGHSDRLEELCTCAAMLNDHKTHKVRCGGLYAVVLGEEGCSVLFVERRVAGV